MAWLRAMAAGPVGVSAVVEGAAAAGSAYRLAEAAARTRPSGSACVAAIDERLPEALLTNSPEISSRLVGQSLGGLLELPGDEREVLLDTLAAFLASDGSPPPRRRRAVLPPQHGHAPAAADRIGDRPQGHRLPLPPALAAGAAGHRAHTVGPAVSLKDGPSLPRLARSARALQRGRQRSRHCR